MTEKDNEGVSKPKPYSKQYEYHLDEESTMAISWDSISEEIIFAVTIPADAYLAIAFGSDRSDRDMIVFDSDINKPTFNDCELFKDNTFGPDIQDDWDSKVNDLGSRYLKNFETRRALESTDPTDFTFQLDREILFGFQLIREREGDLKDGFRPQEEWNQDSILLLSDGQSARSWNSLFELRRVPVYEAHGYWMFVAWMPLGFLLLATKRYLKGHWKLWNCIHIIAGVITLVITIWQTLEISLHFGWGLTDDVHSVLGTIAIVATIICVLTGGLASSFMIFYDGDK